MDYNEIQEMIDDAIHTLKQELEEQIEDVRTDVQNLEQEIDDD